MPDLPEEAVEAAAISRYERNRLGTQSWKRVVPAGQKALLDAARADLQAAAPAIRKQERERLLSKEVIDKAHRDGSRADPQLRPVNRAVIEAAFRSALATLEDSDA